LHKQQTTMCALWPLVQQLSKSQWIEIVSRNSTED